MMQIRRANDRGHFDHGWLDTRHTFSFGHFHDPAYMGYRALRVINEDRVQAGQGFGTHGHRDMEIVSYVLSGALEHRDSMGNGSVLRAGGLQRMSAGTGVQHSEFNPSVDEPVHFYQIWLLPERDGLAPSYEELSAAPDLSDGRFRVVASRAGGAGVLTIHQDVRILLATLAVGQADAVSFARDRYAWVQVLRGRVALSGEVLGAGDGAALSDVERLEVQAQDDAEVMVFDLA